MSIATWAVILQQQGNLQFDISKCLQGACGTANPSIQACDNAEAVTHKLMSSSVTIIAWQVHLHLKTGLASLP